MATRHSRPVAALLFLVVVVAGGCQEHGSDTADAAHTTYDRFLRDHRLAAPLPFLELSTFPSQLHCTPLPDGPPYRKTIESALQFIETRVDNAFFKEATEFLRGGVIFKPAGVGRGLPYSAVYRDRTIFLLDRLFDYGCLEDVVSTLVHEMVHAVQKSRYVKPGVQPGEYSLTGSELDKLVAELEADAFQFHVSTRLRLVGASHMQNMLEVNNARRRLFNRAQMKTVNNQGGAD